MVKNFLHDSGFDARRITDVQNAIDTTSLASHYNAVDEAALETTRAELGFHGKNLLIYCGGMYTEKRLPFLLSSLDILRMNILDLEIVFIGSGPQAHLIEAFCLQRQWAKYLGPKFDMERVKYFKLAKLQVMPGLVGLAVLDSFALRVPIVTTSEALHSPEIAYLENGKNGLIVSCANDPECYAISLAGLLLDSVRLAAMQSACSDAAMKFTVANMAQRFTDGIEQALS